MTKQELINILESYNIKDVDYNQQNKKKLIEIIMQNNEQPSEKEGKHVKIVYPTLGDRPLIMEDLIFSDQSMRLLMRHFGSYTGGLTADFDGDDMCIMRDFD